MSSSVPALVEATVQPGKYSAELYGLCSAEEKIDIDSNERAKLSRLLLHRLRGPADLMLYSQLKPVLRTASIIHIHGLWQQHCVVASRLGRAAGIPIVVSAHGMLDDWAVKNKRIKKAIYAALVERHNLQRAFCLRALSRTEVGDYRRFGLKNPIVVIPNGIILPSRANPDLFLDKFPQLRGRRRVLFLSRIHYKKGLDPLCRAWAKLVARFPDTVLLLAGPDFENTLASVQALVEELGIASRVLFTGLLTGELKWSALAAADMFVLPSYSEGFSVAVLEAMAVSKPVIATHQCNFPEIAASECGVLIQPDVKEIENALAELLSAPASMLEEMGRRGRSLVATRYNWSAIGQQMIDVYDWALGGPKPSSAELFV